MRSQKPLPQVTGHIMHPNMVFFAQTQHTPRDYQGERQELKAPIDVTYADKGHLHIGEPTADPRNAVSQILASNYYPERTYLRGVHNGTKPFIARTLKDGELDTSFNKTGLVYLTDLSTVFDYHSFSHMAEDAEGHILLTMIDRTQGFTHLWKLKPNGKPDTDFGSNNGYIILNNFFNFKDITLYQFTTYKNDYIFSGSLENAPILFVLTHEGVPRQSFGKLGILKMQDLIPDLRYVIGAPKMLEVGEKVRIIIYTRYFNDSSSINGIAALTLSGALDQRFADNGVYWSKPGIIIYDFTLNNASQRITVHGQVWSEGTSTPMIYRLDYTGKPAKEFNEGRVVLFPIEGAWDYMTEADGKLVGYGSFFDRGMAVRYRLDGQLDTTFVPPNGYGVFTAIGSQPGFYGNSHSATVMPESQRLLVAGREIQTGSTPCVIAVSLKQ
ncbi:hypothetical protein [Pseudomonas putida]|uniref:hypothetical protein n=1 Tax=Pseudomonas putida TaxID=303 RepID=UPI001E5C19F1|nr:hypothetical protein [Pseudomonas putida]MDD2147280.1 hypothetical protein [Pseudomonas putida]